MFFARAEYLNLLWLIPLLGLFLAWSLRNRRKKLKKAIGPALLGELAEEFSRGKAVLQACLLLGFFLFSILALARPQWGARLETVRRQGVDIIAALDVSYSMNTEDIAPNRFEKAKSEIRRLVQRSEGDRIGLISFSGGAMVQCPLTLDHGASNLFLDIAYTGMIEEPGTSLAAAIETATGAFIAEEKKYKALVLFTDGEDLEGQVEAAVKDAKQAGVTIYAIGIGTQQGEPIPIRDLEGNIVEYRKGPDGQPVISSLDEKSLAEIAVSTGGQYYRATTSEKEIESLYDDISKLEKKELESRLARNYEDRFQYPLLLAILLFAAGSWVNEKRRIGKPWFEKFRPLKGR